MFAISVDPSETSAALLRELQLPFSLLCDTNRRVVQEWDIYNAREKGGIAKPSVFVIDSGRLVLFASVDSVSSRVPASEIAAFLRQARKDAPSRKFKFPRPRDFSHAIRNIIRFGIKSPRSN